MALIEAENESYVPEDDVPLPKSLEEFLELNFDMDEFQARKGVYLVLMNTKKNDYLRHLQESYALIRKVGGAVVREKTSAMFVCCVIVISTKQFIFFLFIWSKLVQ